MRGGALGQAESVIAAFQHRHNPPAAQLPGEVHDHVGELPEMLRLEPHRRDGIVAVRIEPGGDEDELRAEFPHRPLHDFARHVEILLRRGAVRNRPVHDAAEAGAFAAFLARAGAGPVRPEMERREEDRAVAVEDVLRAVAVMRVPVEDRHAADAQALAEIFRGDRDVVEDAEAHARGGHGVVSGRPDRAEGVAHFAAEDGLDGRERRARRAHGRRVGHRGDDRLRVERAAAGLGHFAHAPHVRRLVDEAQLLERRVAAGRMQAPVPEPRPPELGDDPRQPVRVLRMQPGLMLQRTAGRKKCRCSSASPSLATDYRYDTQRRYLHGFHR